MPLLVFCLYGSSSSWIIHLFNPLIQSRIAEGNRSRRGTQTLRSPATLSSSPWGIPRCSPGQKGHIISPASPGSAPGPPPSRMCSENLRREVTKTHPCQMPEADYFRCGGAAALLRLPSDDQAPHSISNAEPSHPPKEIHVEWMVKLP